MDELELFIDVVPESKQHPIYKMIKEDRYLAERNVINNWARGFKDRDNKFVIEFQTAFEPCLWELYIHAYLKEVGLVNDFSYNSPDFVVVSETQFCIEATVALPAKGCQGTYGFSQDDLPTEFNQFNSEASIRLSNSFISKVRKLRERYSSLPQCRDKPFVIAIASFDRPFAHFAASRPILAALYGLYHDEDATLKSGSDTMISYNVNAAIKNENTNIDMGLFSTPEFHDVSAVIYSSLATWGKIRALADNPSAMTVFTTYTPNGESLFPKIQQTMKSDYVEHLLDGLYVLHNPFASKPLSKEILRHPRIAQVFVESDGNVNFDAPDDFLLLRHLHSVNII
ncbi:glycosaminoglycan attachment site [Pectobacterium sp. CHL-2024]|uniref:glycosaminoglycan attachment site n=1 Tax=Pectobacterium sp. CHL-2024 TaxID=3377079 RepID=UPI00380F0909